MRKITLKGQDSGQLGPVLLLLAAAVIVPTVCLLWYMTQAVENVRLAARQKLVGIYREKLDDAVAKVDSLWHQRISRIENLAGDEAMKNFMTFAMDYGDGKASAGVLITYDSNGRLLYPIMAEHTEPNLPEEFESAWELEFVEKNFQKASKVYMQIAESATDDYIRRKAKLGYARCEIGRERPSVAYTFYREAAYERVDSNMSPASISLAVQARVMLGQLELGRLFRTATQYEPEISGRKFLPMDSATRVFVLQKAIELAEKDPNSTASENNNTSEGRDIDTARRLLSAERMAAAVIERYHNTAEFDNWTNGSVHQLDLADDLYGLYVKTIDKKFLLLRTGDDLRSDLNALDSAFAGADVVHRVVSDTGAALGGTAGAQEDAFLTAWPGENLPDWKVQLYFRDSDVFSEFARRQVTVYIWGGVLVIGLMLLSRRFRTN